MILKRTSDGDFTIPLSHGGRICEWQWRDTTDAAGHMTMTTWLM